MFFIQQRRKCTLLPFLCLMFAMTFYLQFRETRNSAEITDTLTPFKQIVLYNLYHGGLRNDARRMNFSICEYTRCNIEFIDNVSQMEDYFSSADAILFQGGRMPKSPPKRSHEHQVYVFVDNEAPLHLHSDGYLFPAWNNVINWTMTYRLDSDMTYTYGDVKRKQDGGAREMKNYAEIFRNKTKQAAWLVSDCVTESKREKFVAKLKNYIKIDVYGRCGKLKNCTKEEGHKCFKRIANNYKFYLSFENSVCEDYISEKVFTWFSYDIVSVVRGGRSYDKILPRNSYINTDTFRNINELGRFLKILSQSEEAYASMLKLKDQYELIPGKVKKQEAYCELCKRLHTLDENRKTYRSIGDWWQIGRAHV